MIVTPINTRSMWHAGMVAWVYWKVGPNRVLLNWLWMNIRLMMT